MDVELIQIESGTRRVILKAGTRTLTGINKLLQIVVLSLMGVPGRDLLDPELDGGIPELIGWNFSPEEDIVEITSEVSRRITKTKKEVIDSQVGIDLDSSEQLRDIEIVRIEPGEQADEIQVRIRVVNELGQRTDAVL